MSSLSSLHSIATALASLSTCSRAKELQAMTALLDDEELIESRRNAQRARLLELTRVAARGANGAHVHALERQNLHAIVAPIGNNQVSARDTNIPWSIELCGAAALGANRAYIRAVDKAKRLHAVVFTVSHKKERVVGRQTHTEGFDELCGATALSADRAHQSKIRGAQHVHAVRIAVGHAQPLARRGHAHASGLTGQLRGTAKKGTVETKRRHALVAAVGDVHEVARGTYALGAIELPRTAPLAAKAEEVRKVCGPKRLNAMVALVANEEHIAAGRETHAARVAELERVATLGADNVDVTMRDRDESAARLCREGRDEQSARH